ncbi:MAG: hypothetical protein WC505_01370 [Patescibacteria group bacterium]
MSEREHPLNDAEAPVDGFGLTKERRMETIGTNVDLILRRCQRTGVQPRDMMLRACKGRQELNERFGGLADQLHERMTALPDFDLDDPDGRSQAAAALQEMYEEIISQQFNDPDGPIVEQHRRDIESRKQWQQAGLFSYELGEQHELVLHVPPMTEAPGPQQLKDSLGELAAVIDADPGITEVVGSSLLLEHPIAKRFGFTIDEESDEGFNPNFRMPRDEFLTRFGKGT